MRKGKKARKHPKYYLDNFNIFSPFNGDELYHIPTKAQDFCPYALSLHQFSIGANAQGSINKSKKK